MAEEDSKGAAVVVNVEEALEHIEAPLDADTILPNSNRKTWLFAYDILMGQGAIGRYIKGLERVKIVRAPSYRLVFPFYYPPQGTALASLEQVGGGGPGVWGVLYETTKKDLSLLERYLHVPNRYHARALRVIDRSGASMTASAYVLSVSGGEPQLPSMALREEMVAAALERGLPDEWLGYLASQAVAE